MPRIRIYERAFQKLEPTYRPVTRDWLPTVGTYLKFRKSHALRTTSSRITNRYSVGRDALPITPLYILYYSHTFSNFFARKKKPAHSLVYENSEILFFENVFSSPFAANWSNPKSRRVGGRSDSALFENLSPNEAAERVNFVAPCSTEILICPLHFAHALRRCENVFNASSRVTIRCVGVKILVKKRPTSHGVWKSLRTARNSFHPGQNVKTKNLLLVGVS